MKRKRVDEYHKHGCNFSGKLVVIDYSDLLNNNPHFGQFGACTFFDAADKAKELVTEKYGPHQTLLAVPEYVARIR